MVVAGVVCRDAGVVWCSVVWCWRWLGAKRVARSVLNTVAAHRPSSQRATHATRPVATPGSQLQTGRLKLKMAGGETSTEHRWEQPEAQDMTQLHV